MLQFEFITTDEQFLDLAAVWKQLSHDSATQYQFFQDWSWVHGWWTNFASRGNSSLMILVATLDNSVALIWPLVVTQQHGLRILTPPGGLLSCFDDALIVDSPESGNILRESWAFIIESANVDAVEFRSVHENANIATLIREVSGKPVATTSAPTIDIHAHENFDAYLASRSKKMRQNQRRSLKYLSKKGFIIGNGNNRNMPVETAIDTCLSFKLQWLQARGLHGKTLVTNETRIFLHQACSQYQQNPNGPRLCISSLHLDEKPISIGIGFRYQNCHYEYLGGFDYQLEQFGPGRLRMEYGLRDCFKNGINSYNMLTPETSFKRIWTNNAPTVTHYVMPLTIKGKLYKDLYIRRLRPKLKQAYNALPPGLRIRLADNRVWG